MKLSKNVWQVIFVLVAVMFLTFGCEAWIKAEGVDWSIEAKTSAVAQIKKK